MAKPGTRREAWVSGLPFLGRATQNRISVPSRGAGADAYLAEQIDVLAQP